MSKSIEAQVNKVRLKDVASLIAIAESKPWKFDESYYELYKRVRINLICCEEHEEYGLAMELQRILNEFYPNIDTHLKQWEQWLKKRRQRLGKNN